MMRKPLSPTREELRLLRRFRRSVAFAKNAPPTVPGDAGAIENVGPHDDAGRLACDVAKRHRCCAALASCGLDPARLTDWNHLASYDELLPVLDKLASIH